MSDSSSPDPSSSNDLVDVNALVGYIKSLCTLLLDSKQDDVEASFVSSNLAKFHDTLEKFISDPQESVIFLQKSLSQDSKDAPGT